MTLEQTWESLVNSPEVEWIRDMKAYYVKTGMFRPEDLQRLLGEPWKGLEVGEKESLANHFLR